MNQNYYYQQGPKTPSSATSIVCMILGICSIVFGLCGGIVGRISCVIGIVCGVVGLVLYGKVKRANNGYVNNFAKVGFICSIVGTAISTLFLIYFFTIYMFFREYDLLEIMGL